MILHLTMTMIHSCLNDKYAPPVNKLIEKDIQYVYRPIFLIIEIKSCDDHVIGYIRNKILINCRKVFILASLLAGLPQMLFDLRVVTKRSLHKIKETDQKGIVPLLDNQISILITKILSAKGSYIAPQVEIVLLLLAK